MKKLLTGLVSILLALVMFIPLSLGGKNVCASAEGGIPIDVYLLGGQSNAVGCSEIVNNRTQQFNNIWYAAEIERAFNEDGTVTSAYNNIESFKTFSRFVSGGMGFHATSIGPEYGMAKYLNDSYEGEKKALIFKSAHGGTYLHNFPSSRNWYPRSLWKEGYQPNVNAPSGSTNCEGWLYQWFVENFRHVYNELVQNGYKPIIKGMAWMQGEADAGDSTAKMFYFRNLKAFIEDIRKDIAEITGDEKMLEMPFVIGRIAKTFMKYNNPNTTSISEAQQALADQMDNVYAVNTDDLIIVRQDGKINGSGGWDICHYNFKDMVKLGERFAQTFEESEKKGFSIDCSSSVNGVGIATFALMSVVCALLFKKAKEN